MLSKRSTMIALTVLAALSVEIGCGDGSHQKSSRHTLTPVNGTNSTNKPDANGMVTRTLLNDDGTPKIGADGKPMTEKIKAADANKPQLDSHGNPIMPKMNVPKADANLDKVTQEKTRMIGNTQPIAREQLDGGTYTLTDVETVAEISNSARVGEDTRAFLQSHLDVNGNDYHLSKGQTFSAGMISNFTDIPRSIEFPVSFKVDLSQGAWAPNRQASTNINYVDVATTDGKNGVTLTDDLARVADMPVSSIWNMIANGVVQKDGSYRVEDGKTVLYLRLLKQSDSKLVVYIACEEQRPDTTNSQKNTKFDRSVFFTYNFAKDAAAAAPAGGQGGTGGQPGATGATGGQGDDQIHVTDMSPDQQGQGTR